MMNAYDLADELDKQKIFATEIYSFHVKQSAKMLRQQADRIAELEEELEHTKGLCMLKNMQVNGLQQTNAEPVAWEVYVEQFQNSYLVDDLDDPQLIDDCTNHGAVVTPLYTTPHHASDVKQTKPRLSDEEREQLVKQWFNLHPTCSLNEGFATSLYSVVELCKRIEERHRIK